MGIRRIISANWPSRPLAKPRGVVPQQFINFLWQMGLCELMWHLHPHVVEIIPNLLDGQPQKVIRQTCCKGRSICCVIILFACFFSSLTLEQYSATSSWVRPPPACCCRTSAAARALAKVQRRLLRATGPQCTGLGVSSDSMCNICNTIQYSTTQHNTTQHNTMQCNAIQYHTIQYNAIQYYTT